MAGDDDRREASSTSGPSGDECGAEGRSLELAGRLEEAVAAYREAARRAPRNALVHVRLGLALRGAGHDEEANRAFQQALDLSMAG